MKRTVLVMGGGLAGLTAAVRLSEKGYHVTLLEQQSALGRHSGSGSGRMQGQDTIPLVVMGCHRATLTLLESVHKAPHALFSSRLSLEFVRANQRPVRFRLLPIPGVVGTLVELAFFRGLSLPDRWRLLNWLERTWETALPTDLETHTAEAWLREIGQSEPARVQVWNPLCRFLTGDDLRTVSAAVLLDTLIRCFLSSRRDRKLAFPSLALHELLLEPVHDVLVRSGTAVRLGTPVHHLHFDARGVVGVQLSDGSVLAADWYVAALPYRVLSSLLPDGVLTRYSYFQQLRQLDDSAAVSVHFMIDDEIKQARLLLLAGYTFHWIAVRSRGPHDRRTLISLVATGHAALLERSDDELFQLAARELKTVLPHLKTCDIDEYRVMREPCAFLSMRPRVKALRPLQQSPFSNFFLAGGWTDTGLSSTLESAILSGQRCAESIMAKTGQP